MAHRPAHDRRPRLDLAQQRNSVIWNKVKGGPDNTRDRLRNVYEDVFHFVKNPQGYFYDADAVRSTPKRTKVVNGSVVTASGVRGVRYRRQIELSTSLTEAEKHHAMKALDQLLASVSCGERDPRRHGTSAVNVRFASAIVHCPGLSTPSRKC